MIRAGTACFIVLTQDWPQYIGRIVTVVGPSSGTVFSLDGICVDRPKNVRISAPWLPKPPYGKFWCIAQKYLRPIHGPDAEQSIRETDTVRDHDEITRRMA